MGVTRIVPNLPVSDVKAATEFYAGVFGLEIAMELGWIGTCVADGPGSVQLSMITADLTAPMTPVVSIGVDDPDAVFARVIAAGGTIVYPLTDEQWGVRRFFFQDADGNVINVVGHRPS